MLEMILIIERSWSAIALMVYLVLVLRLFSADNIDHDLLTNGNDVVVSDTLEMYPVKAIEVVY